MFCKKCGEHLDGEMLFCPKCGAKQEIRMERDVRMNKESENLQDGHPVCKRRVLSKAGVVLGSLAVVVIIVFGILFRESFSSKDENIPDMIEETEQRSREPLYYIADVASIDISKQEHTPKEKRQGMDWDRSLFYWLEDTSDDITDGNIAKCKLSKTLLRDKESQELNQYEIYSDPENGEVYKIVSVKNIDTGLELVDYYYKDGKPNFAFRREDSVYTPTYATIEKVGERYYFADDVMVRWRLIHIPEEIEEHTLAVSDTWYPQMDYFTESDEARGLYDSTEKIILNASYNVYEAVAENENVGRVQGSLKDTTGNGIAGKTIRFYRDSDGELLYETVTDTQGMFELFVYLDGSACSLKVEADEDYKEESVSGIEFAASTVAYYYDITLHKEGGDEYPVTLYTYSAVDVTTEEDITVSGERLQNVSVLVREGEGNQDGDVIFTTETQTGELSMNLPSGVYTVQIQTDGYLDIYIKLEVAEDAVTKDAYVMPILNEGQTGVVLTWDGDEIDLDLTLFTPYQAENGDMAHIGGNIKEDAYGNVLVTDNRSKCEVMYVNTSEMGSYKLYVNNYTDSMAGNYTSNTLSGINVHIYIYNSNGFVAEYAIPLGQYGVVWEALELNGNTIIPAQRVYSEVNGKNWWLEDKRATWKKAYVEYIQEMDGYGYHRFKLIYIDGDDIPEIYAFGEDEAAGSELCYFSNGELKKLPCCRAGLSYIERQNLFSDSGGHMDGYYDYVYTIDNGEIVMLHKGEYGAWFGDNVQYDENGEYIYEYFWDEKLVSKEEYEQEYHSVFDESKAQRMEWDEERYKEQIEQGIADITYAGYDCSTMDEIIEQIMQL